MVGDKTPVFAGRLAPLEIVYLLISPVAALSLFHICYINQNEFVDPWFYVGYGQNFRSLVEVHGWPYYAVRFPVIFLNSQFLSGDSPFVGYLLLRYLILLTCGVPLYLMARGHYGRLVALSSFAFLLCNPFFLRILLWDLPTFVAIPSATAGMAWWLIPAGSPIWRRIGSGFLFAIAVCSNAFMVMGIAIFLAVQLAVDLAGRRAVNEIARDLLLAALGGMAAVAVGTAFYIGEIGAFDPRTIFSVTLTAARAGSDYASSHSQPIWTWVAVHWHVYVPVLMTACAVVLLRHRLFTTTLPARITWFALAYVGFYAFYRFGLGKFVVEEFYYFHFLTPVCFLLLPVALGEMVERCSHRNGVFVAGVFWLCLLAVPLAYVSTRPSSDRLLDSLIGSKISLLVFLIAYGILLLTLTLQRLPAALAGIVAVGSAAAFTVPVLATPGHRVVYQGERNQVERAVYQAALDYLAVLRRYDQPTQRVLVWYSPSKHSIGSVAFSALSDSVHRSFSPPGMPNIGDYERQRLQTNTVRYVLLLGEDRAEVEAGTEALRAHGFNPREVLTQRAGAKGFYATLMLVDLRAG